MTHASEIPRLAEAGDRVTTHTFEIPRLAEAMVAVWRMPAPKTADVSERERFPVLDAIGFVFAEPSRGGRIIRVRCETCGSQLHRMPKVHP